MTWMRRRTIGVAATLALVVAVGVGASVPAAGAAKRLPTPKAKHFGQSSNLVTNSWFPRRGVPSSLRRPEGRQGCSRRDDGDAQGEDDHRDPRGRGQRPALSQRSAGGADHRLVRAGQARHRLVPGREDRRAECAGQGHQHRRLLPERSGGAQGGIFMPAHPAVGQPFQARGVQAPRPRTISASWRGGERYATPAVHLISATQTEETTPARAGGGRPQVLRPGHGHSQGAAGRRSARGPGRGGGTSSHSPPDRAEPDRA